MADTQRYVSKELSHFVGRGLPEEDQYQLLLHILQTCWLTYPPHDPTKPRMPKLDLSQPISNDKIIDYQVVCFCDIPYTDLAIHVSKYSKFGLAFNKSFLIERGATPVNYIANDAPVPITSTDQLFKPLDFMPRIEAAEKAGRIDRALYFDTSVRAIIDLFIALDSLCCDEKDRYFKGAPGGVHEQRFAQLMGLSDQQMLAVAGALKGNKSALGSVRALTDFLMNHVFTFMKCFDGNRSFEDAANYYMEREWRIGGNVQFTLSDVARVFFPVSYATRFRADFPAYTGQVSFMD
jgi:hypothetical protein